MPPKLDEASGEDPKIRAGMIFYEFRSGEPIFKSFNEFCNRMGSDFMDYLEFEFWFQRFSAGNFDLNYDRSQDPKYRTITDMPVHIFEKICSNLGKNYQKEYWFTLRYVCKSFRTFVDSWDPPKFADIEIRCNINDICLIFDTWRVFYQELSENLSQVKFSNGFVRFRDGKESYGAFAINQNGNYRDLAIDDLMSVLASPEGYKLETLTICPIFNDNFSPKSSDKFQNLSTKIDVDTLELHCLEPFLVNNILNVFQSINKIDICSDFRVVIDQGFIDKIHGIEALKNAEMVAIQWRYLESDYELLIPRGLKIPNMTLECLYQSAEKYIEIIQIFLKSPHLEYCHLDISAIGRGDSVRILEELDAEKDPENPDLYKYRIPDSDEFFEIRIDKVNELIRHIHIERKSNSA